MMKKRLLFLSLAAAMMSPDWGQPVRKHDEPDQDFEARKERERALKQHRQEKIYRNQGLTQFEIEGEKIWALNEKSAIRKFNKQIIVSQTYPLMEPQRPVSLFAKSLCLHF